MFDIIIIYLKNSGFKYLGKFHIAAILVYWARPILSPPDRLRTGFNRSVV